MPRPNPKPKKPIRLKCKKLIALYRKVYERDFGLCQRPDCLEWVELGTPPHHIILKSQGGEDTLENLITLCINCHDKVHRG